MAANEHTHRFWTTGELPVCYTCGKTLLDVYNEAAEQLTQARKHLEIAVQLMSHYPELRSNAQAIADFLAQGGHDVSK